MNRCGLRSLNWNWFLAAYVALIAVLLFAAPAHAAPSFSVDDVTCPEAGPCIVTVHKSAAAKSWSRVTLATADGTATAPGDYAAKSVTLTFGNNQLVQTVALAIVNDTAVEGSETFTVRLSAVRNAAIARPAATVTIADDDVAPAPTPTPTPHPCYDVSGSGPAFVVPGSNCPARMCPGDPNPVPWELPCPGQSATLTREGNTYRIVSSEVDQIAGTEFGKRILGVQFVSGPFFPGLSDEVLYYMEDDPAVKLQ